MLPAQQNSTELLTKSLLLQVHVTGLLDEFELPREGVLVTPWKDCGSDPANKRSQSLTSELAGLPAGGDGPY